MDNLTPQLTTDQLKQNIDALQKGGQTNDKIQAYVNNYQKDPSGNYVLKTQQQAQPTSQHATGSSFWGTVGDTIRELPTSVVPAVGQFATGVAKGIGRTVVDAVKMAKPAVDFMQQSNPLTQVIQNEFPAVKKANQAVSSGIDKGLEYASSKLQATTPGEKTAGYAETAAEFLLPGKIIKEVADTSKEAKALQLTEEELKKINPKKLDWLTKDALSTGKTVGGIIKKKAYEMPQKLVELQNEFKSILKGSPEEMRAGAEKLGKTFKDETLKLFDGNETAINEKTLVNKLEKAVADNTKTIYDSEMQRAETVKKSIKSFTKYVEKGTNKGLEEARMKWYAESKNATGKLSDANKVIHDVLKTAIKDTLPEEEKAAYDIMKTRMAKLFDVQEILKAKIKASIGQSTLGKVIDKAKIPAGVLAAGEGARKLITGQW